MQLHPNTQRLHISSLIGGQCDEISLCLEPYCLYAYRSAEDREVYLSYTKELNITTARKQIGWVQTLSQLQISSQAGATLLFFKKEEKRLVPDYEKALQFIADNYLIERTVAGQSFVNLLKAKNEFSREYVVPEDFLIDLPFIDIFRQ